MTYNCQHGCLAWKDIPHPTPISTVSCNVHKPKLISSFLQILNVSDIFDRKTLRITYYK